jgi:hypothetical protein
MAKARFGDEHMSDEALGEHLGGYAQQTVQKAANGAMSTPIALKIEDLLKRDGVQPGEVLVAALAERSNDRVVKERLYGVLKRLASVPAKAASAAIALTVALGLSLSPRDAYAQAGGDGRLR